MNTIQDDLSTILSDFAKATISGGEAPSNESSVATEPIKVEATPATQDAASTTPEATAPKVEAEPKKDEVINSQENGLFSDWDSQEGTKVETATSTPALPVEVLGELGKALGLEKVTSKDELVSALTNLKQEADKAKGPDVSNIHPELLKAIELSRKGGDFYEYLKVTSVDYSKADPVQLYEDYVIDQLTDASGNVDEDQVNDYLDGMKDSEKKLKGIELQKRLVYEQQRRVADIEAETIRKRDEQDAKLKAALGNLQDVDGFKISDSHRKEVFNWVTSKMMKDLFYGPDGNLDPVKVAKVGFRNLYYDKLDAYQKNKIKNATKREIYADVTNAQITTPSVSANPTTKKGYDIGDYINSLEQKLINK